MILSTQPYKGARDFYPEDKRLQKYIFGVMRKSAEKFGYEEYDAPILEPLELYLAKTGDEIVNEQTYSFTDRGDRQVVIRPEMTPTVSRMVAAKRQELAYPVRWYSIPNLWRYERPQRGRLREHWQLNVDIFGVAGIEAELETIELVDYIMQSFKAKRDMYVIKLNSRRLIQIMLTEYLGLTEVQTHTVSKLIDRMHKMNRGEFVAAVRAVLSPSEREAGIADKLLNLLTVKELQELPIELQSHEAAIKLQYLIDQLRQAGISNAIFDITTLRGFDYYTDIVFEVFDTDLENNRSMFGGGRYDGLVSLFGVESVPTVGFGMGDVTVQNFLDCHKLLPRLRPETDLYVIVVGNVSAQARPIIQDLRKMGLRVAVDLSGRGVDKQIKTAIKKSINNVLFIGEKELQENQFMLKNLKTGKEERHGAARLVSIVKDKRKK